MGIMARRRVVADKLSKAQEENAAKKLAAQKGEAPKADVKAQPKAAPKKVADGSDKPAKA